jgi:maltooligosyltrehalose trehalohydrolase
MTERTIWRPRFGATVEADGVRFAVWAPKPETVEVEIVTADGAAAHPLTVDGDGVWSGVVRGIGDGARYRFRLNGASSFPDPYSRWQSEGVHGPSRVVDPAAFAWSDGDWPGLRPGGLVIYELHVGAMTVEGTFGALIDQLPELKELGVTAIELMPVAQCPGRWNWGYDGVDLFAPSQAYGGPEELKRLVDAAHRIGLGVLLDVVYNHLGPDGNYLSQYSDDYFTDRHHTLWGDALNYDGPNSRFVRDYVIDNACAWLSEYHFDGLRLDATDAIFDDSDPHVLAELSDRARAAVDRPVVLIAEQASNEVRTVRPRSDGGFGLDAVWADDFHHEVRVLLTGEREGYYADYSGTTPAIATAIEAGFVFQGQPLPNRGTPRGTAVTDEPATAFVFCIQNHDQIGNRAYGERLHHDIDADRYHAASALLLFAPETPLLFMGQEFRATASFMFFTDHDEELGRLVTEGRREEFKRFRAFADPVLREGIPDPQAEETFVRSKLDLDERVSHAATYRLYRDLLALRRDDQVLADQNRATTRAVAIGAQVIAVHRWRAEQNRLLIANVGPSIGIPAGQTRGLADLPLEQARLLLSTAARRYGGSGQPATIRGGVVEMPARTAAIFTLEGNG